MGRKRKDSKNEADGRGNKRRKGANENVTHPKEEILSEKISALIKNQIIKMVNERGIEKTC